MAIQRLSHVGVCVSDLENSIRFYTETLGFRRLSHLEIGGDVVETLLGVKDAKLRAVYLERDGTRIELLHFVEPGSRGDTSPRPMNELGLTHLSLRVDDLQECLRTLRAAGVRILEETRVDNPTLESAAAFVTDPDGTRIELVQAPGDPRTLPGQ